MVSRNTVGQKASSFELEPKPNKDRPTSSVHDSARKSSQIVPTTQLFSSHMTEIAPISFKQRPTSALPDRIERY